MGALQQDPQRRLVFWANRWDPRAYTAKTVLTVRFLLAKWQIYIIQPAREARGPEGPAR